MLDIVGLLQTEKNAFTRSERALTEIVLADADSVLKMSIVDLAAQADVSPPTVTRFCRRLLPVNWQENTDILRPTPARYAFLATIDVLAQTVATRLGAASIASMRRIKHQLVINRDGDDGQPLGD